MCVCANVMGIGTRQRGVLCMYGITQRIVGTSVSEAITDSNNNN